MALYTNPFIIVIIIIIIIILTLVGVPEVVDKNRNYNSDGQSSERFSSTIAYL